MSLAPRYSGPTSFLRAPTVDMHAADSNLAYVDIAMVGVPYDGGVTNRPGARYGPRGVRDAGTSNVRRVNQATGVNPFEMDGISIADVGDIFAEHPFELNAAHADIEAGFSQIATAGATALAVGGDHSVTLPILRALANSASLKSPKSSKPPLGLIHIDAHADTGDNYAGSRFHHGAPFKIAVDERLIDPQRTIQIGIRGTLNDPDMWAFSHDSGMRVVYMDEFAELGPAAAAVLAREVVGEGLPCYVSFDIDALDPAYAPGTGTPEIGGLTSLQAQQLIRGLAGLDVVGADLVEVSPQYDANDITALAGANLLFELLCVVAQARAAR